MSRAVQANRRRVRFIPLHSCDASIIVLGEGDAKDRKLRSPMTTDSVHSSILLAHVAKSRDSVRRYVDLNDAHVLMIRLVVIPL